MSTSLTYSGPWEIGLTARETSRRSANHVTVEIEACGICGTDLGIIAGDYQASPGVILGHEAAGVIVEIADGDHGFQRGDRVVIDPTYSCGTCFYCRSNRSNHCALKHVTEAGVTLDGCFTRYYSTEPRFLRKIPDTVSMQAACLTEPLSCVLTGARQLQLGPQLTAIVIGGGPIGLLYALLISQAGVKVCIAEQSVHRRKLIADISGQTLLTASSLREATESIGRKPNGLVDVIVDTSGRLAADALKHLARGGQLACIGLKAGSQQIDIGKVANESITIFGSIDTLGASFDDALAMIERRQIPAERIISDVLPLTRFREALANLGVDTIKRTVGSPASAMKIVLQPKA